MKILVFDIWGDYAHFKKIYATTSALSYLVPTKPTIYGYLGAIMGLEKRDNAYLRHFVGKSCRIGIALRGSVGIEKRPDGDGENPTVMRRMGVNLRAELGRRPETASPKPTLMEFVYRPKYRIFVAHDDPDFLKKLQNHLESHTAIYTPSLGLAGLLSNFEFVGEAETTAKTMPETAVPIHSIIPKRQFLGFEKGMFDDPENEFSIVEQSMFAIEMDAERNVTERDDILLERKGKPILARVRQFYPINDENVVLF